jgi:hypothetical protein
VELPVTASRADYSADQIEDAIVAALRAHDVSAAVSLLRLLAGVDPVRARTVYDTMLLGLALSGTDVTGL